MSSSGSPRKMASPKKKRVARAAKPKTGPNTSDMVAAAITAIKDRKGSSLQAIKKYVCANNKVDAIRINGLIRRSLKAGVVSGKFKQASGVGAAGRFRMGAKPKAPKKKKVKKAKKPKAKKVKKAKKPKAKKVKKAKKPKAKKVKKAKKPKAKKPKAKAAKKPAKKAAKKPAKKVARKAKKSPKKAKGKK